MAKPSIPPSVDWILFTAFVYANLLTSSELRWWDKDSHTRTIGSDPRWIGWVLWCMESMFWMLELIKASKQMLEWTVKLLRKFQNVTITSSFSEVYCHNSVRSPARFCESAWLFLWNNWVRYISQSLEIFDIFYQSTTGDVYCIW